MFRFQSPIRMGKRIFHFLMAHNNSKLFSLRIVSEEAKSLASKAQSTHVSEFLRFPAQNNIRSLRTVGEEARSFTSKSL